MPTSLQHLQKSFKTHYTTGGVKIVLFNDKDNDKASFAFSAPVGYFNEFSANVGQGVSNLVSKSMITNPEFESESG